jgi:hypothetical protein
MNTLIQIRTNIYYSKKDKKDKKDKDEFIRHNEIILLVDKAKYTQTNSGEIVRERDVDELRFSVSKESLEALIETLTKFKDVDETHLR